ncbi:unnamed protein product, partial [Prunus brigantina]
IPSRGRPLLENRRVVMEPHERKIHALVRLIRNKKQFLFLGDHFDRTRTCHYERLGHRASSCQVLSSVGKIGLGTRREDTDARELGGLEGSRQRLGGLEGSRWRHCGLEGSRRRLGGLGGSRRPGRI